VADAAEAKSQHPDIDIRWNRGSAARNYTTLEGRPVSRKNEHVNLRVACPHHRSSQRILLSMASRRAWHGWTVTSTGAGRLQPQAPPAPATAHQPDPHHRL
jgi:hypothetical protein